MIIITDNKHQNIAKDLSIKYGCDAIIANVQQFIDGSLEVKIDHNIKGQDVMILQSISAPVNDHLIQLLLIADTARNMECGAITAFIPYLGYSRQDKSGAGKSAAIDLIAKMIEASGISKVITIDIHSKQASKAFNIEIENIPATHLFAPYFQGQKDYLVISPDLGGSDRAKALAQLINADYAVISKKRDGNGDCSMSKITSNIAGRDCIIIDDIIDSGATLYKAHELLIEQGAKSISACITHAICSAEILKKTQQLGWHKFYITDSVYKQDAPEGVDLVVLLNTAFSRFFKAGGRSQRKVARADVGVSS